MGRLEALCSRICDTHHVYLREHLPRLAALIVRENGKIDPPARGAMKTIAERFRALSGEITPHLMKEEQILFPTILSIERALAGDRTEHIRKEEEELFPAAIRAEADFFRQLQTPEDKEVAG